MRRAVVALAAVVLLLAGCSPQDRVIASVRDGSVIFISCEEISGVQHIQVDLYDGTMWHSRGEGGEFGPGIEVEYGVDPEGFETDIGPGSFGLVDESISFALVNTAVRTVGASVDSNKLVEGKWLDQNGQLHDAPCR